MRHLRWNGKPDIDFFCSSDFSDFRASLDAEMKRLQDKGIGSKRKQAQILTVENKETLWSKDLLGDKTPQSLLVYVGLFFPLRNGREHRQLRSLPCQIEVIEHSGRPYFRYIEEISKKPLAVWREET